MKKAILILVALIAIQAGLYAQADLKVSQDTVLFHFKPGSYDFLPEYKGNEKVVRILEEYAEKYRNKIEKGDFVIRVNTYTESGKNLSPKKAKHLSYMRSIRMKSYMILFRGMNESYFRTTNHVGASGNMKDVSVLSFIVNPEQEITKEIKQEVEEVLVKEKEEKVLMEEKEAINLIQEQQAQAPEEPTQKAVLETHEVELEAKAVEVQAENVAEEDKQPVVVTMVEPFCEEIKPIIVPEPAVTEFSMKKTTGQWDGESVFNIRTNLLEWAMLTPNIGAEYRINNRWSALLELNWTHWNWKDGDRHYRLWSIAPSVHYQIDSRWYTGVGYQGGNFGFKLGSKGKQGSFHAVSLLGGYIMKLNKTLSLDFGLGLGYVRGMYDQYLRIDGCNVVTETGKKKNYFGPTRVDVTLIWSISNFLSEKK